MAKIRVPSILGAPMVQIDLQKVLKFIKQVQSLSGQKIAVKDGCKTFYEYVMKDAGRDLGCVMLDFYFSLARYITSDFKFCFTVNDKSAYAKLYFAPLESFTDRDLPGIFQSKINKEQMSFSGDLIVALTTDFEKLYLGESLDLWGNNQDILRAWTFQEFVDEFIVPGFFNSDQKAREQQVKDAAEYVFGYLPLCTWINQFSVSQGLSLLAKEWLHDKARIDKIMLPFSLPNLPAGDAKLYAHVNYIWPHVFNGNTTSNGKKGWLDRVVEQEKTTLNVSAFERLTVDKTFDSVYSFLDHKLRAVTDEQYSKIEVHDTFLYLRLGARSTVTKTVLLGSLETQRPLVEVSRIRLQKVHLKSNLLKALEKKTSGRKRRRSD